MWIEICNSEGVVQGHLNLERLDIVKVGAPHGQSYFELKITQGTVNKTFYIDGTDLNKVNRYFDRDGR